MTEVTEHVEPKPSKNLWWFLDLERAKCNSPESTRIFEEIYKDEDTQHVRDVATYESLYSYGSIIGWYFSNLAVGSSFRPTHGIAKAESCIHSHFGSVGNCAKKLDVYIQNSDKDKGTTARYTTFHSRTIDHDKLAEY